MPHADDFDLADFLPYLLAMAADATSARFQPLYRERYGMLRTEWRVLFHLGRYGEMTARDVCDRAHLHKTKVSRAVAALTAKRLLTRMELAADRRREVLSLTRSGRAAFEDLYSTARRFDEDLTGDIGEEDAATLRKILRHLAGIESGAACKTLRPSASPSRRRTSPD